MGQLGLFMENLLRNLRKMISFRLCSHEIFGVTQKINTIIGK